MMTDLATLQSLRSRVANAPGPDREIDLTIERAFNTSSIHDDYLDRNPDAARPFTSSIDAALAWMERGVPDTEGWVDFRLGFGGGAAECRIATNDPVFAIAPTPALAIILAGLDALISKEKTDV